MKFNYYTLLFLLLNVTLLKAQQLYPLSLDELFERGEKYSLQVRASHIQELIAGEKEQQARIALLPEIKMNATVGYIGQPTVFKNGLSNPIHPDMPDWSHNYNVELTQPLYRGGKIKQSVKRAALDKQMARLSTTNNVADVKLLLLQQYMGLFTLHKQQNVLERNIEESRIRLKDIRKKLQEGLLTRNDEIRSELELTNYELSLREVKDDIYIVSQQLDAILGLDESLLLLPDTSLLHVPVQIQSCDIYIEQAYQNYPEMQMARYRTRLAMTDKQIARADYRPTLSLHAGNTLARPLSTTMEDMFNNNWNIALSLSYPLSSLYTNHHKMKETKQYIILQQNAEEEMKQQIRTKVRSAYIRHEEALDRVEALRLSVKQAEENYRIVHNRYMNQLSILTDLLDAANIRLQQELQLTAARANVIYTYYELLRVCGNL
jgi:outer membrane protein